MSQILSALAFRRSLMMCYLLSCSCTYEVDDLGKLQAPSICGGSTDWQDVESYNGTLGPSVAFVNAHQGPVGYMGPVGCSGTLIGPNLFLTAGHCVPSNNQVSFNYQLDPSGNPRPTDVYNVSSILEDELGGIDYAVVQLDGPAGDTWGTTVPSAFAQPAGQPITLIQHPNGIPKVIEGGTLAYESPGVMSYGDLDTLGGSSGSGILQDATGLVIGVHTNGVPDGACDFTDPNTGQAITAIVASSATVRQRAIDAAKLVATLRLIGPG